MSIFIQDFKYGMDRRRARVAGLPGTLWVGKNVHISRGGDIERPKKFVVTYSLPAGKTFGLAAVKGQLYTFGSDLAPVDMPVGVQYQRLVAPEVLDNPMVEVLDARPADGKFYVIARFLNGNIYHYYDGVRVTDWDTVAATNSNLAAVAEYLADLLNAGTAVTARAVGNTITITANEPGTPFSLDVSTVNAGSIADEQITRTIVQTNVPAVAETRASGTLTITGGSASPGANTVASLTVNGVQLLSSPVDWLSSNASTANSVAARINNTTATHGYSAVAVGATVTFTAAPGTGATVNDHETIVTTTGNVSATKTNVVGGVTAVAAVAEVVTATLSGTFEAADAFIITLNGTNYIATGRSAGMGTSILVHKKRVWCPAGPLWQYSKLNDFDNFSDASASSGAGFINVSTDAEGTERLVGAAPYQNQVAVFSRRNIRLYDISADAQENAIARSIDNSGAVSARSILGYGNIDTFYLDETGVRSIRAHEQNAQAFVSDIGTAIDPFIREYMDTLPNATIARAVAGIEPREGRFWLALGARIFVLSYFPQSEVNAWSYYEPGFSVSDIARAYNRIYVRAGDTVYLYGGVDGSEYPDDDEMIAEVQLPFISTVPPAREKLLKLDLACTNEWRIQAAVDPNNESALVDIGRIHGVTYNLHGLPFPGRTSHVGLKLTCSRAGAGTISNLLIHHTEADSRA